MKLHRSTSLKEIVAQWEAAKKGVNPQADCRAFINNLVMRMPSGDYQLNKCNPKYKELCSKFATAYGTDKEDGLPWLVFCGKYFSGNKDLMREAIAENQVQEYTSGGLPWAKTKVTFGNTFSSNFDRVG